VKRPAGAVPVQDTPVSGGLSTRQRRPAGPRRPESKLRDRGRERAAAELVQGALQGRVGHLSSPPPQVPAGQAGEVDQLAGHQQRPTRRRPVAAQQPHMAAALEVGLAGAVAAHGHADLVQDQRRRHVQDIAAGPTQAQAVVGVLAVEVEILVEVPDGRHRLAAEQHRATGGVADGARAQGSAPGELADAVVMDPARPAVDDAAVVPDPRGLVGEADAGRGGPGPGRLGQGAHQALQAALGHHRVVVQQQHVVGPRRIGVEVAQAQVVAAGPAAVHGGFDDLDRGKGAADVGQRAVGRGVVHEHDAQGLVAGRQQRPDAVPQQFLAVPVDDDDGQRGSRCARPFRRRGLRRFPRHGTPVQDDARPPPVRRSGPG